MGTGSGSPRAGLGSRDAEQDEFFGGDPRIAPGLPRPVGWRVRMPDGTAAYDKFGTGDTDWVPVGTAAAGGVTQIVAGNNISISPGGGTGVVTINANGTAATWPEAFPRVFAVDGVNGNDANAGFADAASASAADYRAACAAAGLVAKKTLGGLAAIFPAIGAGRMAVILIASGTYADDLALVLGGVEGYLSGCPIVRGTVTNASAGAVAFAGTTADETMAGAVTGTGLNAAGYNPAAATVQQLVLTKMGGGSPAFAAEGAVPLGLRVRFDNATTTAALRGVCRQVCRVSGADTVNLQTNLPAGPVNTDVCYLEQAGVVIPDFNFSGPGNGKLGVQFVGIRSSGTWGVQFADAHFALCGGNALLAQQQTDNQLVTDQSFTHPIVGLITPGGGFRSETTAEINRGGATLAGLASAGSSTFRTMQDLAWGSGCAASDLTVLASRLGSGTDNLEAANIGNNAGGVGIPHTFGPNGIVIDGSDVILGDLICIGASAADGIQLKGTNNISIAGDVSGTAGNTGSGFSLRGSSGSRVAIANAHVPTVTGASSDIVWSGGAFDNWSSFAIQEQYDAAGNHIFLAGTDIGTKTITPSVAKMTNNSGAPIGSYLFVKQTGASSQFQLATAGDTPDGIIATGVPNGGTALVGPLSGYRVVSFDGPPTLGALVYVSPLGTGAATTTDPGGQQPLGVVVDTGFSLNRALVHFGAATTVPNLAATWNTTLTRVYAVDFNNGNDANKGYADPATSSAGDYATACAAAGAVAKKTFAGLAAIFPKVGAGRKVEIVIRAATYTDSLELVLNGVTGYANNCPEIRGTDTIATAGCVAFDGSAADCTAVGMATATGMNAAGYNPTGAPTTTVIQCLKVGGAAPAFGAVPAKPLGVRLRFDSATTTAALRNVCQQICNVTGTDTLTLQAALPAVPAAGDVFYLEEGGVIQGACTIQGATQVGTANAGVNLVGWRSTGTLALDAGTNMVLVGCGGDNIQAIGLCEVSTSETYTHPVRGALTVGGGWRGENAGLAVGFQRGIFILAGFVHTGQLTVSVAQTLLFGAGCAVKILALNGLNGFPSTSGAISPTVGIAGTVGVPLIFGPAVTGGLLVDGSKCSIANVTIQNAGAHPAIKVNGVSDVAFELQATNGSTGNTDVGMDLTSARGSRIAIAVQPTVTGTAGDVRLSGSQILTWAQANAGFVDTAGNRIIGTGGQLGIIKFSGTVVGGAGAVVSYLDDGGPGLAANQTTPIRYPTSQRIISRLRVNSLTNSSANAVTCTLYKNAVATTMQVSIPAGSAANTKFVDSAHPILFADGDDFDLRLDDAADVGGVVNVSALLEYAL
jgi:hypothetical protein